ncbi:copper resistance CopC family protein [Fodinicola feengrottensis]|uniref:copper resistance CopC family protein n=1 Tax=Fodinicola feengrottensis TaxID=435914 RepID=UPI0013D5DBD1|nr:copper resistance CopC family protein [Fodinicola feengrottensis]
MLATAAPAAAHDVLISSSPANGASVAAPTRVTFTFNDVVLNNFAAVVVTGPDGKQYQDGAPRIIDTSVSVNVKALPVTGAYTASYRIVSADGHPVSGDIKFTVTTTKPGPEDPNAPGVPVTPSTYTSGGGSVTPYVIGGGIAILLLALGAVILASRRRPTPPAEPPAAEPSPAEPEVVEEPAGRHRDEAAGSDNPSGGSADAGRTAE